jgi:hypothetical protein
LKGEKVVIMKVKARIHQEKNMLKWLKFSSFKKMKKKKIYYMKQQWCMKSWPSHYAITNFLKIQHTICEHGKVIPNLWMNNYNFCIYVAMCTSIFCNKVIIA